MGSNAPIMKGVKAYLQFVAIRPQASSQAPLTTHHTNTTADQDAPRAISTVMHPMTVLSILAVCLPDGSKDPRIKGCEYAVVPLAPVSMRAAASVPQHRELCAHPCYVGDCVSSTAVDGGLNGGGL
jgi:hypothetical protein